MADLMNDTFTFDALSNKYGNFGVPAAKILIDGSVALPLNKAGLSELEVTLSVGPASSAVIKIVGAYDRKTRTFDSDVTSKFSLGTILEVELGYLSDTTNVFKGFISSVIMEFKDSPVLIVMAMDVRRLMMQAEKKAKYYDVENYSDITSAIMSDYSKLCTFEQESTSDQLQKTIYQNTSDYHFIKEVLAKKLNKEFFVFGKKAYFRKPKSVTGEVLTLEYGLNLLAFQRKSDYLHCKVVVGGYDKKERVAIFAEEEVENSDSQTAVLSSKPEHVVIGEDAESEAELIVRAKQIADEKMSLAQTGKGTSLGLPEIAPGRFIKLSKLDTNVNKKYYIVQVQHHFGEQGFYTDFEVEGWE